MVSVKSRSALTPLRPLTDSAMTRLQARDVERALAAVGPGDVDRRDLGLDLLDVRLGGARLAARFAVEHEAAGGLVLAGAHQHQFDLVLHLFDLEGAAFGAAAGELVADLAGEQGAEVARARRQHLATFRRQHRLGHRARDALRIEGAQGALAAAHPVMGEAARVEIRDRRGGGGGGGLRGHGQGSQGGG